MGKMLERGRGGLQATTNVAGLIVTASKMEREEQAVRAICYITERGVHRGTGFLVGPDLVLTCHHVVGNLPPGPAGGNGFACVFDATRSDRPSSELRSPLAVKEILACSPSSVFEATFSTLR